MSASQTFVVHQPSTGLWVMDCCADECWPHGLDVYEEFATEHRAKLAATRHRKWHREQEALEYPPCPHCGADARHRKDIAGAVNA